jgi:hypothetical protein
MGAWNNKPFGNDTALDWLNNPALLSQDRFPQFLQSTIQQTLGEQSADKSNAEKAIAAISVVSAAAVEPIGNCDKDAKALISKFGFVPTVELINDCLSALQIICYSTDSELRELWLEAEGLPSWLKQTEKLASNLNVALLNGLPTRLQKKTGIPRTLTKLLERYKEEPTDEIRQKIFQKFTALEDVNGMHRETDFKRPLNLASANGLFEETQLLINGGAKIYASDFEAACVGGNLQVAELLRANGAEVFAEINPGENYSAKGDFADTARALGTDLLPTGYRYCPALFTVASKGKVSALEYLISLGADIYQSSRDLQNLAHFCCAHNNVPVLIYLHDKGFDLGKRIGKIGRQPLDDAVYSNAVEAVKFLLANGVDPNWVGPSLWTMYEERRSPLDIARLPNLSLNKDIEKLLLSSGAKTLQELEKAKS